MEDKLFTPAKIGPLTLRNRAIRSAAFEGMCPGGVPSDSLVRYHRSVAAGGVAMTSVAYVAVTDDGRTFAHQAWMDPALIPDFRKVTDGVHAEGALASVQLGHAGNMADRKVSGKRAMDPSGRFNLFGLALPRKMSEGDILAMVEAHARAVRTAREAGFDAVEIHAGHGYLLSQFLSPHTNRRRDAWGGTLENRARFLRLTMRAVKKAAGATMAVLVKTNLEDGFPGGMGLEEGIQVARILEEEGADALILSGGFVSIAPFYMLRGTTPHRELIRTQKSLLVKLGMVLFARIMVKEYPFREAFFLEDGLRVRRAVNVPLVYVGGLVKKSAMDGVLSRGFDFVSMARSLVAEPDFMEKIRRDPAHVSPCLACGPCNSCVAVMYNGECRCTWWEREGNRKT